MAIIPEKINFNNINEIKKGDAITPETINAPLKASAYAQEIVDAVKGVGTNQPNNDNANNVGEPRVEIETLADGTKRLKFSNLKGESGADANQNLITNLQKQIDDLYVIANETVIGTEEISESYSVRQTANGLSGLIDGASTKLTKVQGGSFRGIKSTGKNLFNQDSLLSGKWTKTTFNGFECFTSNSNKQEVYPCYAKAGSVLSFSMDVAYENTINVYAHLVWADGTYNVVASKIDREGGSDFTRVSGNYTLTKDLVGITIIAYGWLTAYIKDIMLNFGETALPFEPYHEETLMLENAVELGENDYIDFEKKLVYRESGNTETLNISSNKYKAFANGSETVIQGDTAGATPIVTNIYVVKKGVE